MTGKTFKITVIVLLCILITVLLAVAAFAVINGYSVKYMITKFFPGTVENVYKPYQIVDVETSQGASAAGCSGYLYILDDKNLIIYDDRGNEKISRILDYQEPIISGSIDSVLIYDKATGDYLIFRDGEEEYSDSIEKSILGASVQRNGYCVFILKGGDGFLGSAVIVNDKNEVIASSSYSDRFPITGCVMPDSERYAVSGIYSENPDKTGIEIYEFYKDTPVAGYNRDILTPLVAASGKSFIAVGSDKAVSISADGSEQGVHNYHEVAKAVSSDKGVHLTDRISGVDRIIFIGEDGNEKWSYNSGLLIEGIVPGERHLFYWSGINAVCIDDKGKPVELKSGFDFVLGMADIGRDRIAVITPGRIIFYEYH